MDLLIRDYDEADSAALKRLVAAVWPDDEAMQEHAHFGHQQKTPTSAKTLVAVLDARPVGFASSYQNPLHYHPLDFRVSVVVDPNYRRRGLGSALYEELLKSLPLLLPKRLRCLTLEDSIAANGFLAARGYGVLLTSYTPALPVAAVSLAEMVSCQEMLELAGYSFCTLAELHGDPNRNERLAALCLEAYADTHTHSPPTASLRDWQDIFLGEHCIEEAFFVACSGGRYAAFSSLRRGETSTAMEAMWDGVSRSDRALEVPLRLALKAQEVRYARAHGVHKLHWEVDSTDIAGMELLKRLPFERGVGCLMWVKVEH